MLYLAYGSNMSPEQMAKRCPGAKLIGAVILKNYALTFAGWSASWGGGVATVVRKKGSSVSGAIYRINAKHLATLDRYEGVPFAYMRCKRKVAVGSKTRQPWVYIKKNREPCLPTQAYVDKIAEGYCAIGLPLQSLQDGIDNTFDALAL